MLLIPTIELQAHLRGMEPFVEFPALLRAPYVMVPSREWFEAKWNQQWWEYCTGRSFRYLPGSGMCEQFARAACVELNFCCIETVRAWDASRRDVHVAALEAFVLIPPGELLNGVADGGHATVLVALTEDGATYDLYFWEPQNRQLRRAAEALAAGVRIAGAY